MKARIRKMFKRLMKMKEDKKGFTLAELLIVVAIIGVLVAISVPIFTAQLKKATLATNQANARSAKAAIVTAYLEDPTITGGVYSVVDGKLDTSATGTAIVTASDDPAAWVVGSGSGATLTKVTYKNIILTLDTTAGKEGTVKSYGFY